MKRRLSAVLLALGLTVSSLSMGVYAEETETTATEQVTEATTEAETEAKTEATESETAAAESETAAAEEETEAVTETETLSPEEQQKAGMTDMLTTISGWDDEMLARMMEEGSPSDAAVAANWSSVKEELGAFVEVTDLEENISEDLKTITVICHAKYDKVDDKTDVVVTYEMHPKDQTVSINWEINYTMGKKMEQAGLNTIMGLGIVFLTLLFLSFLIAQMHFIPDMIEKMAKKDAPAPAQAPAAAPTPAVAEEEDLTDDLELVAVITAAIAASENTSSDGFVVRSIKKANKRNWQRA